VLSLSLVETPVSSVRYLQSCRIKVLVAHSCLSCWLIVGVFSIIHCTQLSASKFVRSFGS